MDPNLMLQRVMRLARLDTTVFDEVRDDPRELVPALVLAGISCLLAGLGGWLWVEINFDFKPDSTFVNMAILGSLFLMAMYAVWVIIAYVMLMQVYHASVDLNSLFRTMGYAAVALAPTILMFIPVIYPVFYIVPVAVLLIMTIYAVQACTNAEPTQVIMANLVGFAVMVLVLGLLSTSGDKAPLGAGMFALIPEIP